MKWNPILSNLSFGRFEWFGLILMWLEELINGRLIWEAIISKLSDLKGFYRSRIGSPKASGSAGELPWVGWGLSRLCGQALAQWMCPKDWILRIQSIVQVLGHRDDSALSQLMAARQQTQKPWESQFYFYRSLSDYLTCKSQFTPFGIH